MAITSVLNKPYSPGYYEVIPSTSVLPGQVLGDATPPMPDLSDHDTDDMVGSKEAAFVVLPTGLPRGASGNRSQSHNVAPKAVSPYEGQASKHCQEYFPEILGGDDSIMAPEESDDKLSVMASASARFRFTDYPAAEARTAKLAHNADQGVGEQEQTTTGAIGVWAIAGPV